MMRELWIDAVTPILIGRNHCANAMYARSVAEEFEARVKETLDPHLGESEV